MLKHIAFWDAAQFVLMEVDRRYEGMFCPYYQGDDDGGSTLRESSRRNILEG
jgi:hypothetical protein